MYRVGNAPGAFQLGQPDTGREPSSCVGVRENSLALQAPSVTRLAYMCGNVCYRQCVAAEVAVDASVLYLVCLLQSVDIITFGCTGNERPACHCSGTTVFHWPLARYVERDRCHWWMGQACPGK